MKNLDQIRAANALEAATGSTFGGVNEGEVAKKVPTMIMENGMIAAAAFANETGKGYEDVFKAVIEHLKSAGKIPGGMSLETFIKYLCDSDSSHLRAVTAESLAYLNYLRRFAKKGD